MFTHLLLFLGAWGLHYYADANEEKCFSEDLPATTHIGGAWKIEMWDSKTNSFISSPTVGLSISVYVQRFDVEYCDSTIPCQSKRRSPGQV